MIGPAVILAASAMGPVVLRGSASPDPRPVSRIDIRGVEVKDADGVTLIGWERVKQVIGEDAPAGEPYMRIADDAWRAERRLARGDFTLAEPLLERLAARLTGVKSGAALLASAGLARVRLARGEAASAVAPWLNAFALHADGLRLSPEAAAVIGMDEATGLMPDLPPIFAAGEPGGTGFAGGAGSDGGTGLQPIPRSDPSAPGGSMTEWFRLSARVSAGESVAAHDLPALPAPDRPTEHFVALIVLAFVVPDADDRAHHRAALRDRLPETAGTWREAWARLALGRSLLREADPAARDAGLLELLHVPARFAAAHPRLASIALGDALDELLARSEADAAGVIEQQLKRLDPRHPALSRRPLVGRAEPGGPSP